MGDAIAELVAAGQEGRTGRRAGGADVILGEAQALRVQAVEVRGLQDGVSVAAQFAVALIIAHDEDDVGAASAQAAWFCEVQWSGLRCEQKPQPDQDPRKSHGSGVLSGHQFG